MDYLKVLKNNNKIISKTTYCKEDVQTAADLTLRCVFSGNERCSIGRRELLIYADSFIMLNKGTQYNTCISSETPVQSFAVTFDKDFVNDFYSSYTLSNYKLLNGITDTAENKLNETLYPFNGDIKFNLSHLKANLDSGLNDELLINEYLHHCLITYNSVYNKEIFEKARLLPIQNAGTRLEILRRLNLAKEYLYSNYDKNINLNELAAYACLSVNHLLRTFKQAFGRSPHQFLTDIRLKRAQQLLRKSNYSVNEVVTLIGFECPSSFIRLFKQRFETTPLIYRQSA
ncbi:helix-turn-helix transcriptional regulator [Mucilaginibacter sp. 14171R-50]|uniref:helix-turn-helix transcriptional regulator n=1 Tax=Mucilaginibacter sp. 14171R-50 TaxID=2703789 RepID=UPI00138B7B50|nr:AraC family transcriptional regulator [Mucilaginibacter sp. 14171R-50]QHS56392.1 helix-turn-helix transcriptional regulator [Mucilaginibacter sp. 14171R-50]